MTETSILLIAGPTASGKSALALRWARERDGVILNADSQQLYRDLRVLTARPTAQDEARVEHRLYGVADASDTWSVGRWSRRVLDEIRALDGRSAVIVGGTGLYMAALTRGLADIPPVPHVVRDEIEHRLRDQGEDRFRAELARGDPAAEARISVGDRQRLVRAAAVLVHTGRSLTDWTESTVPLLNPDTWSGVVLEPPREALYAACDARIDRMIAQGAVEEVAALLDRRLSPDLPAMKAVGVRELGRHRSGEVDLRTAVDDLRGATRRYAKRQMTWFRNQSADWPRVSPG